jgi:ornithine lipid ester-linked acyl 2-hydroxylase
MELLDRVLYALKWHTFCLVEWLNRTASRVGRQPFLDRAGFPWATGIEGATPEILRELAHVQATQSIPNFQDISYDQEEITTDDKWKTFFLYGYGYRDEANCRLCPHTDRALQQIPGLKTAMFSILAPGKVIPPHRGPYNGVLRYHLGLIVPDGGRTSGIRVGGETRGWQVGESLVFDDSYEHEAWNHSAQQRVVLFVDFERPLRFPVNLLNKLVLAAVRRSRFVQEAVLNLRKHREKPDAVERTA